MTKMKFLSLILGLMFTSGVVAQNVDTATTDENQAANEKPQQKKRVTQEEMTERMISELKLDTKQAEKVTSLNQRFKTLIEGEEETQMQGRRPPMGENSNGKFSGGMPNGTGAPGGFGGGMNAQRGGNFGGGNFGGGMPGGSMSGGGMSGGGMPGGGMGGPRGGMPPGHEQKSGYNYESKQLKYDKKIRKILTEEQFQDYQKIKSDFASQKQIREFLQGDDNILTTTED